MVQEKIKLDLIVGGTQHERVELSVYEVVPENRDLVLLEMDFNGENFHKTNFNLFTALQELRQDLEKKGCQVLCNGAALNAYPSSMQISMARGRLAYLSHMGHPARREDIIDIFERKDGLCFVKVKEQNEFHIEWINSIMTRESKF